MPLKRRTIDLDGDGVDDRREGRDILVVLVTYVVCVSLAVACSLYL